MLCHPPALHCRLLQELGSRCSTRKVCTGEQAAYSEFMQSSSEAARACLAQCYLQCYLQCCGHLTVGLQVGCKAVQFGSLCMLLGSILHIATYTVFLLSPKCLVSCMLPPSTCASRIDDGCLLNHNGCCPIVHRVPRATTLHKLVASSCFRLWCSHSCQRYGGQSRFEHSL